MIERESDSFPAHVTDAPAPIPTEGVWTGDPADLPNWDAMPRRNRRRRRRSPYPVWLKYLGWCIGLAALITLAQIAFHAVRSDPRDARVFAERELRLTLLKPNERVVAMVNVWQRPAIDYFRATRGLLVLTDAPGDAQKPIGGRLIYLGLQPRDPLSPVDAPPTFDEREWPVDTSVAVTPTRTFFMVARGLQIAAPREGRVVLGIPSPAADDAAKLEAALAKRYVALRDIGWQRREARRARERARVATQFEGRRVWYHTVRRGEALASVARTYGATPEQIREWNGIVGDRIKIGQTLIVKPWTKTPMPFPAGVTPERSPAHPAAVQAPVPAPVAAPVTRPTGR
jgi:hypothetical protein